MSWFMLHGLGDCTPERHCGCLSEEAERVQEVGGSEGRPSGRGGRQYCIWPIKRVG